MLIGAIVEAAQAIGIAGIEVHTDDALRFLARETRAFDVIFLDPPFADDPWPALLPALRTRVADNGSVYAEAGRRLDAPPGWELRRHARAGHVHYHLLAPA
jgi:16S rRNA (guanine966-N2)-methyltransferase